MIIRMVSVALIVSLVTGCASTRQFQFQSEPPGATVNISGSTCKTPCFIGISNKEQIAEIFLQTGQKEIIRIEAEPGFAKQAGFGITRSGAITLELLSIPLLAFGLIGVGLMAGDETDSFRNRDYEVGRDGFYISIGSLVSGALLYSAGHELENVSDSIKPLEHTIFVDFRKHEAKPEDNWKPVMTLDTFTAHSYQNSVLKHPKKQSSKYKLEYQ